jgi:hypothetical protein
VCEKNLTGWHTIFTCQVLTPRFAGLNEQSMPMAWLCANLTVAATMVGASFSYQLTLVAAFHMVQGVMVTGAGLC